MAAATNSKPPVGKPIIFFHGDKGGVGKSFACSTFIDTLVSHKIAAAVVDGDPRNPDVERMFGEELRVKTANLRSQQGWMDLTDFLVENADLPIIVSLPAGVGGDFAREAADFFEMAGLLKRPVSMFWVINLLPDSINLLNQTLDVVGTKLHTKAVVKNLFFGEEDQFTRWDNSDVRKRFEAIGGKTVCLQKMHDRVVDKLFADAAKVAPFSLAVVPINESKTSSFKLTPSENMELIKWLRKTDAVFAPLHVELGV